MSDNKNIEYEKFVKDICANFLYEKSEITTTEITHNKKLCGNSGVEHQIDVYWEYKFNGLEYKTIIECKNYAEGNPIELGKIRDIIGLLHDLGDSYSAIFVTASNYQKGAKQLAEFYGIRFLEIRVPTQKDWKGRVKTISVEMTFKGYGHRITPFFLEPILDEEDIFLLKRELELDMDSMFIEENGEKTCVRKLFRSFAPDPEDTIPEVLKVLEYENAELVFEHDQYPARHPISKIEFYFKKHEDYKEGFVIDGAQTVKAIIKDVKNNAIRFIEKNNRFKDVKIK